MPSYGSLHSPSLRKMNGHMEGTGRNRIGRGAMSNFSFSMLEEYGMQEYTAKSAAGHIVGDPFALATISIAYVCLPDPSVITRRRLMDWMIACLVDRFCCFAHCRHSRQIPPLRLVDHRIRLVHHSWYHHSDSGRCDANIPRRRAFDSPLPVLQ